jgi:hypothetical protein
VDLLRVMPDFGCSVVVFVISAAERGGTDDARGAVSPLDPARISPLAALSLFVKDEIAHPAHEVSCAGVPIRGAPPAATEGEGRAVSGIDWVYLRIRAR